MHSSKNIIIGCAFLLAIVVAIALWIIQLLSLEPKNAGSDIEKISAPIVEKSETKEAGGASPREILKPAEKSAAPNKEILPEKSQLELELIRSDGRPAPGATIVVFRRTEILAELQTNASGIALMGGRSGVADLVAAGPSFAPYRSSVDLAPGKKKIVLPASSFVSGKALVEGQAPKEELSLKLESDRSLILQEELPSAVWEKLHFPEGGLSSFNSETDESGSFRFDGLSANWSGELKILSSYYFEEPDGVSTYPKTTLRLEHPETGIVLLLHKLPEIRGRAVSQGGEPVPQAKISYAFQSTSSWKGQTVTSTGTYSATADQGGRFSFFLAFPQTDWVKIQIADLGEKNSRSVSLEKKDIQPVTELGDVELRGGSAIFLEVFDPAGAPVSGAITSGESKKDLRSKATDSSGKTELQVPEQVKEILVAALGFTVVRVPIEGLPSETHKVILEKSNLVTIEAYSAFGPLPGDLEVLLQLKKPLFRGGKYGFPNEVYDSVGASLPHSTGIMVSNHEELAEATLHYHFNPEGKILLIGINPDIPFTLEFQDGIGTVLEEKKILGVGQTEHLSIRFVLSRPFRVLKFLVQDSDGKPITSASVSLETLEEKGKEQLVRRKSKETDAAGRVQFPGVCAEKLKLWVAKEGFLALEKDSSLLPVGDQPVTLTLQTKP